MARHARRLRSLAILTGLAVSPLACGPGAALSQEEASEDDSSSESASSEGDGDGDGEEPGDGDGDEPGDGDGDEPGDGDGDEPGDGDGDVPEALCEIADPFLEQEMAEALDLDAGPIPVSSAETLTYFSTLTGPDPEHYPSSLEGIGCAANLVSLAISPGSVTDLSPLTALGSLSSLSLNNNQPATLAPLNDVPSLVGLNLWRSAIADGALSEIADIPLTRLMVGETQITTLDEILLFEELRLLSIGGLPIADLSPLADREIVNLHLSGTPIADVEVFTTWGPGIACLRIADTPVTDLSPLLEVNWVVDVNNCGSCPGLGVSMELLDDFSVDVVIPTLCEMGVNVNGCLFCPQ